MGKGCSRSWREQCEGYSEEIQAQGLNLRPCAPSQALTFPEVKVESAHIEEAQARWDPNQSYPRRYVLQGLPWTLGQSQVGTHHSLSQHLRTRPPVGHLIPVNSGPASDPDTPQLQRAPPSPTPGCKGERGQTGRGSQ